GAGGPVWTGPAGGCARCWGAAAHRGDSQLVRRPRTRAARSQSSEHRLRDTRTAAGRAGRARTGARPRVPPPAGPAIHHSMYGRVPATLLGRSCAASSLPRVLLVAAWICRGPEHQRGGHSRDPGAGCGVRLVRVGYQPVNTANAGCLARGSRVPRAGPVRCRSRRATCCDSDRAIRAGVGRGLWTLACWLVFAYSASAADRIILRNLEVITDRTV